MPDMKQNWYKPIAFWSWNAALDPVRLCEQVEEFSIAGFGGFFIHARAGLKIPYMGKEWFDCCHAVCQKARQLQLDVYLYDEDGWPSGFAGGLVPQKSDLFCQRKVLFTNNAIPKDGYALSAYQRLQTGDYELVWSENDGSPLPEADLFAYYTLNKSYSDLTSKEAVGYFIQVTHDIYYEQLKEYFGDVIKGIFTDEPQLVTVGFHWGEEVKREYQNRFHRSLLKDLWMLEYDGESSEETAQVRHNYRLLLQQLLKENFTKQIYDWCNTHGIEFTGHFASEDGQLMQIEANAGVMYQYESFHMPGIDHLGRRFAPLPLLKQIQSVAAQTGKQRTLSETFGCAGWNISFESMTHIWGWQAINGLNTPCLHLSAYSLEGKRKRDYPPVFSYQTPWWDQIHHISKWMTNVNRFFSECERCVDLLVIQPMHYIWERYAAHTRMECRRLSSEFRNLTENLRSLQLDFDLGDESLLADYGRVKDGQFLVGKQNYSMVMVSETEQLEEKTICLLQEFIEQGGRVVFIGKPPQNASHLQAFVQVNNTFALRKYFLHIHWIFPAQLTRENDCSWMNDVQTFYGVTQDGITRIGYYSTTDGIWKQDARLNLDGNYKVWSVDPYTGERIAVSTVFRNNRTEVSFTLKGRTLTLFEAEQADSTYIQTFKETSEQAVNKTVHIPLNQFAITTMAPNCLTLDMAELICDGESIGQKQPICRVWNILKQLASEDDKEHIIDVRYTFKSLLPEGSPLMLALELDSMQRVSCNGIDLAVKAGEQDDWFVDRSIRCIPVGAYVHKGINEIVCTYRMTPHDRMHYNETFETERNRFCPTLEPENIYLIGDFTLKAFGKVTHQTLYISVSDENDPEGCPDFVLSPVEPLQYAPFTEQGLWFYRGNIQLEANLPSVPAQSTVKLQIKHIHAALCTVQVNDNPPIPLFTSLVDLDITPFLSESQNRIKIILHGTNRNLMGPHHHCKGEIDFIGTESFEGILNWTDLFSPELTDASTWTDRYSFTPFGMEECELVITE